jgi:hypothetical protein
MIACKDIGMGKLHIPELLGSVHIDPITTERTYHVTLEDPLLGDA